MSARPTSARASFLLALLCVSGCTVFGCTTRSGVGDEDGGSAPRDSGPPPEVDAYVPPVDSGPPPREPVVFIAGGAPTNAPDRFEGSSATSAQAPSIAYPSDGVIVPPNLGGLEIHFQPSGHTLFELRFEQDGDTVVIVYAACQTRGEGCAFELGDLMWQELADERARGAYELTVRGMGAEDGDAIGTSEPISMELATEPVTGGLYFWSTEPAAIHRYDFDRGHRTSELFFDSSDAEGRCVGCHALSRDGSTIAIGYGTEGPIGVVDVATRTEAREIAGQMAAFSPDATELVLGGIPDAETDAPLTIVRADGTGTPIDLGFGFAPDWSPDGDFIARNTLDGALRLLERSAEGTWTPSAAALTPGGSAAHDRFASFAPDSRWIAFSRVTPSAGAGGSESHVWVIRRDGDAPVRLERAGRGAMDSMPRWNPSVFVHRGHGLYWLTFTSDMQYGVEPRDGRRRSIWMAAFDPTVDDGDPSFPAFRLPGQPTTGSSFIPQWTTSVERQPCESNDDCRRGEMCNGGVCVPEII